jgi:hypothetical protein
VGHAHHFLTRLDRVSYQQTELALRLYNDAPLVKYILSRSALPEDASRVAICLDDRHEGPFLIVSREGKFITCLARGMHHDLPLVRRWQLDALAERHGTLRRDTRANPAVEDTNSLTRRMLRRIMSAGPNLSREEFLDLAPLQPLMYPVYGMLLAEVGSLMLHSFATLRKITHPRPADRALLELWWNDLWLLRTLYLLMGVGDPEEFVDTLPGFAVAGVPDTLSGMLSTFCAFPLGVVGAWHTARFGGRYLPTCMRYLDGSAGAMRARHAALELAAIASLHPAHAPVVDDALRAFLPANDGPMARRGGARFIADVLGSLARPKELDIRAAEFGAELTLASFEGVAARRGWKSAFDVPLAVARPLAARAMLGWWNTPGVEPILCSLSPSFARFKPEDFFLPQAELRDFRHVWKPSDTLRAIADLVAHVAPNQPVRRAGPKVGRNAPCPCGSTHKYKKCCLGAAKPAVVTAPAHQHDLPHTPDNDVVVQPVATVAA